MTTHAPKYGADLHETGFPDGYVGVFNINRLDNMLDLIPPSQRAPGIYDSYIYVGTWKSTFPWHTEDMDLYSLNYLHSGAAKTWYFIPPRHAAAFERLVDSLFPLTSAHCEAHLRHKTVLISPDLLTLHGIPFHRVTQYPGQLIVTFPYAYHAGFNHGFNVAEATNFATPRWVLYGIACRKCTCRPQGDYQFDMRPFVQRYLPGQLDAYDSGSATFIHPDNLDIQHPSKNPKDRPQHPRFISPQHRRARDRRTHTVSPPVSLFATYTRTHPELDFRHIINNLALPTEVRDNVREAVPFYQNEADPYVPSGVPADLFYKKLGELLVLADKDDKDTFTFIISQLGPLTLYCAGGPCSCISLHHLAVAAAATKARSTPCPWTADRPVAKIVHNHLAHVHGIDVTVKTLNHIGLTRLRHLHTNKQSARHCSTCAQIVPRNRAEKRDTAMSTHKRRACASSLDIGRIVADLHSKLVNTNKRAERCLIKEVALKFNLDCFRRLHFPPSTTN